MDRKLFILLVTATTVMVIVLFSHKYSLNEICVIKKIESIKIPTTTETALTMTTSNERSEYDKNGTRIFCLIKSYLSNWKINKTTMIYQVWGRKCDEYRFIMLIPEELRTSDWKLGKESEVEEPLKILQPAGLEAETHEHITNKIYRTFLAVFARFPYFNWYYLVDDDTYVNVNNLREFLRTKDSTQKVTFGFNFKVNIDLF